MTSQKYQFCASLANKAATIGSGEDEGSSEMQSTAPSHNQTKARDSSHLYKYCNDSANLHGFCCCEVFLMAKKDSLCYQDFLFFPSLIQPQQSPTQPRYVSIPPSPNECLHQREKRKKKPMTFSSLGQLDCLKPSVEQMT